MKKVYYVVKARRPEKVHEQGEGRHWIDIGIGTEQPEDGNILVTLNALPLNFDGKLKLVLKSND